MNSLGNKRVELFDMGAGGSEPTAEENVQMASGKILFLSYQQLENCGLCLVSTEELLHKDGFEPMLCISYV